MLSLRSGDVVRIEMESFAQGTMVYDNRPYVATRGKHHGTYELHDMGTGLKAHVFFFRYEFELDKFLTLAARKMNSIRRKEAKRGKQ